MLVSQIISRVQNNFGDADQVMIYESHMIDWINEGMLDIVRETQCLTARETSKTAADFRTAASGAGVIITGLMILKRVLYGGDPLALWDAESIDRLGYRTHPDNPPVCYYMDGMGIYLFPTPVNGDTTAMVIHYVPEPTFIDSTDDIPGIPTLYHGDLADFVLMKAHERNENWRAAETIGARFYAKIGQRKYESLSQDDTYRTISPDIMDDDYMGVPE